MSHTALIRKLEICISGRVGCGKGRTPRGRGQSTCARIAEIMSGRAIFQQGLATTCKDLRHEIKFETARLFDMTGQGVGYAVRRGERIAKKNNYSLID